MFSCEICKIRKNAFPAEHHQTTASSDYGSINSISNGGRITKTMYQFEPQVKLIKKDTPGETTGFRSSRL